MISPMTMPSREGGLSVQAMHLQSGDVILEPRDKGAPLRFVVRRRNPGCTRNKTHVETVGGKNWCYDAQLPVDIVRE